MKLRTVIIALKRIKMLNMGMISKVMQMLSGNGDPLEVAAKLLAENKVKVGFDKENSILLLEIPNKEIQRISIEDLINKINENEQHENK